MRCIEKSNLFDKPEELLEYLSTKLDTEMGLNPADQRKALDLEAKRPSLFGFGFKRSS